MGLDFSKVKTQPSVMATAANTKNEIEVVETYDIVEDRQQMNEVLVGSQEVDDIVSTIEVNNLETIVSFGAEVAEEISKASDVVLNNVNMSQLDDSSEMLNALARVMEKFDIDELQENPSLFGKLFGNMRGYWINIIQWGTRWIRSMSSFANTSPRSSSPTAIWTKCLRRTSIIIMSW